MPRTVSSSGLSNKAQRSFVPSRAQGRLTLGPLGGGPAVQPHDHGGEGHLAFHAVLPDGVDNASWEVDVEVAKEDDAVRVLRTDGDISSPPRPG